MTGFAQLWKCFLGLLLFACLLGTARADIDPPHGNEPTIVHTYLYLEDINDIQLGTGTYDITANLVMRWIDPRLAFTPPDENRRPQVWMGKRAERFVDSIWHPILDISGEKGITSNAVHSLAIYPDGTVVLRQKFTGTPRFTGELIHFPFGRLTLGLSISSVAMDESQMQFRLTHLSPSESMAAVDDVLHGNWTPTSIKWRTSTVVRPDQPEQQFPQINLQIVVEHDFIDGVHKILLPLTVIGLVSWGLLWLNFVQLPPYSSPRIGGTITLMLTTIALKFVLDRELPVVHYLTLSDLLFNGTIIMLSFSLITSCFIAGLISMQKPHGALAFNRQMLYVYPVLYIAVMLVGYFTVLD
ncbi:MAG TPA: hypothetical protein VL003_07815 [Pusillimonas sp.]|uniref:hypothetical protein n=1 Tax=Pusillimonas sp. TaxID=3040095 RepID=UPI002CB4A959|nr:hypothetical protein [Pusillimonas sp.]HUH87947.1 hypothetical protein [Pusillimonas sp.]